MVDTDSMGRDEVADFRWVSQLSRQNSGPKQWPREQNLRIQPSYEMQKVQVCIFLSLMALLRMNRNYGYCTFLLETGEIWL